MFFRIWELFYDKFVEIIPKYIPCDYVYTVFIRVIYNKDEFLIAANQLGFNFNSLSDLEGLFDIVTYKGNTWMIIILMRKL